MAKNRTGAGPRGTDDGREFCAALDRAGEKPPNSAAAGDKKNYSERLSSEFCNLVASGLASRYPKRFKGIRSGEHEVQVAGQKSKKIDVLYSTQELGLALDVSVKTQNWVDMRKGQEKKYKKYSGPAMLPSAWRRP